MNVERDDSDLKDEIDWFTRDVVFDETAKVFWVFEPTCQKSQIVDFSGWDAFLSSHRRSIAPKNRSSSRRFGNVHFLLSLFFV